MWTSEIEEITEDPVSALPIGPEEIACLASAKVPDGTNAECEALASDLWEHGTNHPVPAIFVNNTLLPST